MKTKPSAAPPSLEQIRRSVASSTAIETGASVKALEDLLKKRQSKFRHLQLAG